MDIRQIIKAAMESQGVTQVALQEMTGVLQHRISDYLRGKRDVNAETLARLMDALKLEIRPVSRRTRKGR